MLYGFVEAFRHDSMPDMNVGIDDNATTAMAPPSLIDESNIMRGLEVRLGCTKFECFI